jgi:hypothetical protein
VKILQAPGWNGLADPSHRKVEAQSSEVTLRHTFLLFLIRNMPRRPVPRFPALLTVVKVFPLQPAFTSGINASLGTSLARVTQFPSSGGEYG